MKRIILLAAALPCVAFAQTQFQPPGGLPLNTPIGTAGDTLQTMRDGVKQNASDIAAVETNSLSAAQAAATYLPLSGGVVDGTTGKGVMFKNPSPQNGASPLISLDFSAFWNELTLTSNAPGSNLLTLWNKANNGFTAVTFRGNDPDLNKQFEHYAIGYFPGLSIGGYHGYSGMEVSSYDMTNNGKERASPFVHQETGAHFDGTGIDIMGVIPAGAMSTITCPGGCTFPAGINGDVVESQQVYGLFPKNTVIASGAGTSTLTMSNPANFYSPDQTNGQPLVTGGSSYTQADMEVEFPMLGVGDFTFSTLHDNTFYGSDIPFFYRDFRKGRVGIYTNAPQSELDVVGNAIFGATKDSRATFGNLGILNTICQPGTGNRNQVDRSTFLDGVNTLQALCLTNPGRYRQVDLNMANSGSDGTISEQYLDGSRATRFVAHPVVPISASRQIMLTDCGTTITVSGTSPVTLSIGTGLVAGCRVSVSQLGTGGVSISSLSGETVGWYDTQAQTGTYTLPGQYSSAVIEAKTTALATIERGQ